MCSIQNVYNIYLTDNENFKKNIEKVFTSDHEFSYTHHFASSVEEAKMIVKKPGNYVLIINYKDIDYDIINQLNELSHLSIGIIVMVNDDRFDEVFRQLYRNGILVLKRPVTVNKFIYTLKLLVKSIERKQKIDGYNTVKLSEIRYVDVAKMLLIAFEKMNEDMAHRYLEKLSMDLRVNKQKASEYIIGRYIKYE